MNLNLTSLTSPLWIALLIAIVWPIAIVEANRKRVELDYGIIIEVLIILYLISLGMFALNWLIFGLYNAYSAFLFGSVGALALGMAAYNIHIKKKSMYSMWSGMAVLSAIAVVMITVKI